MDAIHQKPIDVFTAQLESHMLSINTFKKISFAYNMFSLSYLTAELYVNYMLKRVNQLKSDSLTFNTAGALIQNKRTASVGS